MCVVMVGVGNTGIVGVIVFGVRGSGRSHLIRSLASLLPKMPVVACFPCACDPASPSGCCAGCEVLAKGKKPERRMVPVPVVDLPLGTTADRLAGALDIERALAEGVKAFEPGLLDSAHRGVLHIYDVNLPD